MKKPRTTTQERSKEVVHLPLPNTLYKAVKKAADDDHRTIINFLQLAAINELQKRGVKL